MGRLRMLEIFRRDFWGNGTDPRRPFTPSAWERSRAYKDARVGALTRVVCVLLSCFEMNASRVRATVGRRRCLLQRQGDETAHRIRRRGEPSLLDGCCSGEP